ncbi:VOC family protein [Pseudoclavibacter sp. VKM Ac-2867]|uniref:VOC family protein n=1 Tax=Pseudoclavibacter sp. VKM Ac-2867 TaxID=2783829 RepID=UPI00188D37E3|nr:VOC family protein [Pseudoclavibacter sp. VKM Ac-2867]MBF4459291.1 VOC family protein [Pseudoclavibacter sp. VKM Ac-2867]
MQKIIPNLWFNKNAEEAGEFYASSFPKTTTSVEARYPETDLLDFQKDFAGLPLVVGVEIDGYRFTLINAGDQFRPNPSVSFMLNFDSRVLGGDTTSVRASLDKLWTALSDGGKVLMPLQEYPFSPHYGWVEDRYGVSWQLMFVDPDGLSTADEARPFIVPSLLFGAAAQNRAREAIDFYVSLFPDARIGTVAEYPAPSGPAPAGAIMYADFQLAGQWFVAMDNGAGQEFGFDCGVSLEVDCADQAEIDHYWNAMSAVPEAEQCGWLADRFGVSWQIVPTNMGELMARPDGYEHMMQMKKLVIADF